ncbi:MAG: TraR/DksA C4-type zinc finger protein [Amaricoccus sp.]|uniref:TraR/DksA family transcriptional regulator n=1 Tax=Amaricoccus sp. TaxID=1872485 RepID=UPI003315DD1D
MKSIEERKERLTARLEYLNARLHRIDQELDEPVERGEESIEREDDEVLEDLGASGLQEIRMIEAALDRIEQGTFGACVVCGEAIAEARLDALPQTPVCRDCAT